MIRDVLASQPQVGPESAVGCSASLYGRSRTLVEYLDCGIALCSPLEEVKRDARNEAIMRCLLDIELDSCARWRPLQRRRHIELADETPSVLGARSHTYELRRINSPGNSGKPAAHLLRRPVDVRPMESPYRHVLVPYNAEFTGKRRLSGREDARVETASPATHMADCQRLSGATTR